MSQLEVVVDNGCEIMPLAQVPPLSEERLIVVSIVRQDARIELVRQKHDVGCVKNWFRLVTDVPDATLPDCLNDGQDNLLRKIHEFFASAPDEEIDKYEDALFDFRMKHDLRFAFRGCDVASAIIFRRYGRLRVDYQHNGDFVTEDISSYPSIPAR